MGKTQKKKKRAPKSGHLLQKCLVDCSAPWESVLYGGPIEGEHPEAYFMWVELMEEKRRNIANKCAMCRISKLNKNEQRKHKLRLKLMNKYDKQTRVAIK